MSRRAFILAAAAVQLLFAEPRGIAPRAHRSEYYVTSFTHFLGVGAEMVGMSQATRLFGAEIARHYVIVEVGFYSKTGAPYGVRQSDFALRMHPSGNVVQPARLNELGSAASSSLPETTTSRAVAGYLFFPASLASREGCEVEYTGNGVWLGLPIRPWR
jgi:hypothetical protein